MLDQFEFIKEKTKAEKKYLKLLKKKGSNIDIPFYTAPNLVASNLFPKNQAGNIVNIFNVANNIKILTFVTAEKISFFKAGQYIDVSIKKDGIETTRSFYFIGSPVKSSFSNSSSIVVYQNEEDWAISEIFNNWTINTKFNFSKPKGDFTLSLSQLDKNYLFLVNGKNIIPCLSIVQNVIDSNYAIKLMIMYQVDKEEDIYWIKMLQQILETKKREQIILPNYFITSSKINKEDEFIKTLNPKRLFFEKISVNYIQDLFSKFVHNNIRYYISGDYKFNNTMKGYIDSLGNKEVSIIYNDYFLEDISMDSLGITNKEQIKTYKISWFIDDEKVLFEGKIKNNESINDFIQKQFPFIEIRKKFPNLFNSHRFILISGNIKMHLFFKKQSNVIYNSDISFADSDIKIKII
ncbi:MAG: hypothetical protein ACTTJO_01460 [Metamycoplasmataceae bacterium]